MTVPHFLSIETYVRMVCWYPPSNVLNSGTSAKRNECMYWGICSNQRKLRTKRKWTGISVRSYGTSTGNSSLRFFLSKLRSVKRMYGTVPVHTYASDKVKVDKKIFSKFFL